MKPVLHRGKLLILTTALARGQRRATQAAHAATHPAAAMSAHTQPHSLRLSKERNAVSARSAKQEGHVMTNESTYRQGKRPALLLGLAGLGITLLAMTGAPALAATAPPGNPPPSGAAASAGPAPTVSAVPVPAPGKPLGIHPDASSCGNTFEILSGFTASATTVHTGSAVTLTATMTCDIGPTIYWVQIFDTTTGALVGSCAAGTSCSFPVSQSVASAHNYIAYLDRYSSTYPPATVYEKSLNIYVTWEAPPNNFLVSLQGPSVVGYGQGPATYTASTNQNVWPSPYWIEIFDETTGTRLGFCSAGTRCSVSFTPAFTGDDLVAFVAGHSSALPPTAAQASSNVLATVQEQPIQ
jgi:hypothetical protein